MSQVVAVGKEDQPFVGRENEQKEYWDFLVGKSDAPWLLVISGLGGIGKSTLLNALYKQTLEQHALPDTFAILLNFDTSADTEPSLQTDSTEFDSSRQISSPQPDASLCTDPLLFLNELAHWLKPYSDAEQFDAFIETLQKGRTQLAQFKEQVEQTSQSFVREHSMQPPSDARQTIRFAELEVNRQVRESVTEAFYRQVDTFQPERLVIMLDTCELLNEPDSWIFSQWLMNEFLPELHSRMWRKTCFIVMASRIPPESEVIDEYDQQHLILSMLDEDAVNAYLEEMGVDDSMVRHHLSQSIYKITRGHALCVAIIAQSYQKMGQEALKDIDASVQTEFDEKASLTLINERILNRLDDPFKGLTQYGVLLRTFTLPLLRAVFPELLPESDAKAIFDQFIRYPYIESRGNYRYAFHELIREVLAKNTQKKDPTGWRQYHKRALDYFSAREGLAHSMDWYYHNLAYEEAQGMSDWRRALQEAREHGDIQRVSSLLRITDDVALNLTALSRAECAYEWGHLSVDRRQPLDKALGKYEEALRLYQQLGDHPEEARLGQANVLQAMGDVQQSKVQLDKALHSYQDALNLLKRSEKPSIEVEAQVLKKIGDVQQLRGNLGDLDLAVESYKQALSLFQQVGKSLQAAQVLKEMGDVELQRRQQLGDLEDLNAALENYEQALGLFRQTKHRSKEDEAKILEAVGDVYQLRYRLSSDRQDLEVSKESYQQAFVLFSDDTNARKRVKEKVEGREQREEPAEEANVWRAMEEMQQQQSKQAAPPEEKSVSPTELLPIYTEEQGKYIPPQRPPRFLEVRTILLIGLAILIVVGSIGFLLVQRSNQTAALNANTTATANAFNATTTALASSVAATADAFNNPATATALVVAANPNQYGGGTLALYDPLGDNSNGNGWSEGSNTTGGSCKFIGGAYHAGESNVNYFVPCIESNDFSNFAFEVQMTIIQGDGGGILFRLDNTKNNYYAFFANNDGFYNLGICVGGTCQSPFRSGTSSALHQGLGQRNVIAVVAQGSTITVYANQQQITSVTDSSYGHGVIGLVASPFSNNGHPTEVVYSNARVWTF